MRKKILWLSHVVPYPPKRGVLLRAHNLVKELSEFHDVHLIALNQKNLIVPYLGEYKKGSQQAMDVLSAYCASVEFVDAPTDKTKYGRHICALKSLLPGLPYNIRWLESAEYQQKVDAALQKMHFDVVHCDTISLAPYVDRLIDDVNAPKLSLDHHNIESHMLLRRAEVEKNRLKKWYFHQEGVRLERYEKKVCPKFDVNITCSDLDSQRLEAFSSGTPTYVAPNSVDVDFFKPSDAAVDAATFIFIGTLTWYPNLQAVRYIAFELWEDMKKNHPNIKMNVIGANPPKDLLEFAQRESGFNILGFVDDLTPYLNQATGYLCPISDGGGTKLKLLDAMASGKAIVAHEVACEGLLMEHGETALKCKTQQDFIQAVNDVVNNASLREGLEKKSRVHAVEHFSSRQIGKKLAEKFTQLSH